MAHIKGNDKMGEFVFKRKEVYELPEVLKNVVEASEGTNAVDVTFSGRVIRGEIIITDVEFVSNALDITEFGDDIVKYSSADIIDEGGEDSIWELSEFVLNDEDNYFDDKHEPPWW